MTELVRIRGLSRRGIRLSGGMLTNAVTRVIDLDNTKTRRDLAHHSAIGQFVVVGDAPAAVTTATGLAVTAGTTTTISSAAGDIVREDGGTVTYSATNNTAVSAADVTNPRIDLVSRPLAGGAAVVTAGTAAASPVPPALPANSVPVATVRVPANAASSAAYTITDVAPRLLTPLP